MRSFVRAGFILLVCAGCGEDLSDIPYGEMGSLVDESGKTGFRFGAASAATQIEDQNTNTDWYWFTLPTDQGGEGKGLAPVGDAAGGYTRALDDVALVTDLHLDSYRFSMEWARIEPTRDVIDEAALQHYSDQLDALLAAGIQPMITVHHFSNPVWIDDPRDIACASGPTDANLCGLGHPTGGAEVIAEMAEFAGLLAERFGDRVDEWATLNEPVNYLLAAYGTGQFPPGKMKLFSLLEEFVPVVRDYLSAHAGMYHAIKAADTQDANGDGNPADVGLTLAVVDWKPAEGNRISTQQRDIEAANKVIYVFHHLAIDSITNGTFDANLDGTTDEEHADWADTLDWLGIQYYFRAGVTGETGIIPVLEVTPCFSVFDFGACITPEDATLCVPTMGYEFRPEGLYDILVDMHARYPDVPMLITEAGIATNEGARRAENIVRILEQVDRAKRAGADIRGYYHWSLIDNFEWHEGFDPRFGLYRVDYDTMERTATEGATVLGEIASARKLTAAQRGQYGGTGPMTPEPGVPDTVDRCSGLE
jgi:beta-glucosidase/6-phospho-beta-glucosidase/beta-galactosidase